MLKTLTAHSSIQSVEDMKTSVKWIFADKHGDEVLALLRDLDKSERNERKAGVLKGREEWKAVTASQMEC